MKAAYEFTLGMRGHLPGPSKIWLANPKLLQTITPTGAYLVDSTGRRNTSIRRCVDGTAKGVGGSSDRKACDAVSRPAAGGAARASAAVLEGDR
jgi:hypothetical protein